MIPLIIVVIISVVLAIGAYQLIIQKWYWGPKGPPKEKEDGDEKGR